ncbi:Rrt5p [Zygosaccharomyces mellis]|uniref:Regulator of rDNA transcription protein 5 n=1 Tax=Zygosaccharomyces mellis TaxID=42258 RepID=A0A4C2E5I3_9SACH|nr:Rrt5p [Zygosaccharomyces mellis]
MEGMSANRVYVSNLNFNTTEDELFEHFKEFQVVSVLIPSQTVRFFRNNQVRPLGIGYAEFPNSEKVREAIEALNGKPFKDRDLRLKPYVPYSPERVSRKVGKSRTFSKLRRSRKESRDILISASGPVSENMIAEANSTSPEVVPEASNESSPHESERRDLQGNSEAADNCNENNENNIENAATSPTGSPLPKEVVYSKDTLYLGYLPKDVDDIEIRDHLENYHPNEIWIFRTRPKGKHLQLHRHFMAALVTIKTRESLDDVVAELSKKRFNGKKITIRKARLGKLKEVQGMADSPPTEQVDVDAIPQSESEIQLQETAENTQQQEIVPQNQKIAA